MAILKPVKKQLDLENWQNIQDNFDAVNKQVVDHVGGTADKHSASAITEVQNGSVQAAVDSLQGQIDSISAADSNAQIGIYSLTADGTNDYTATYEGLTYFNGLKVSLSIPHGQENTGAATLNLNSIGAKNIKYYDAEGNKQPLVNNELIGRVLLEYDGTDFVVLSAKLALQQELDAHKVEKASQIITTARDISITGNQVVTGFTRKIKRIDILAFITGVNSASWGYCLADNSQTCMPFFTSSNYNSVGSKAIAVGGSTSSYATGAITINADKTITILWEKYGTPTGTANIRIIAHYHGED